MYFTTLASGSKGNCTFVGTANTRVLVDAGISAGRIVKTLQTLGESIQQIKAILITHEHTDHISGVQQLAQKYQIPVYASPKTWQALPFAEVLPPQQKKVFDYQMQLGDLQVEFCKTSHDAAQPVGILFQQGNSRLGFVTDTGAITKGMLRQLRHLDGLVVEANHSYDMLLKGPYPQFLKKRIAGSCGHLSNWQTAQLLCHVLRDKPVNVVLAHLSEINNRPEVALQEVRQGLQQLGMQREIALQVAPVAAALPLIQL